MMRVIEWLASVQGDSSAWAGLQKKGGGGKTRRQREAAQKNHGFS
jgi:hypothetical protein